MELRGIEPLTSAVRLQRGRTFFAVLCAVKGRIRTIRHDDRVICDTRAIRLHAWTSKMVAHESRRHLASIIDRMRAASLSIEKGLLITAMRGSKWPLVIAAFSA